MSEPGDLTRRSVLAGAGGLAAAAGLAPAAADAAARARRLGEPRNGTAAAEVFGQIDQAAATLTGYGFLTRLHGLADAALFRAGTPSEATARLTFFSIVHAHSRFARGNMITTGASGRINFHLNTDGADFDTPRSFAVGAVVASFAARFQETAVVTGPNQAVTTIAGELHQRRAHAFRIAGRRSQLGHRGLRLRLSATGAGVRTDPTVPRAVFDVGGQLLVAA